MLQIPNSVSTAFGLRLLTNLSQNRKSQIPSQLILAYFCAPLSFKIVDPQFRLNCFWPTVAHPSHSKSQIPNSVSIVFGLLPLTLSPKIADPQFRLNCVWPTCAHPSR